VFADPPFNIGKDFGYYNDYRNDYWGWTTDWLKEVWRIVRHGGSCYLKNHWHNIGQFDQLVRSQDDVEVRNLIVWQKGGGLASRQCYSMRWEALWFVTKGRGHTFNLNDIRVPSKTKDSRNNPGGKNPTDCWHIPRVAFGSKQRVKHPTQCPIALLRRIVLASSNLGDIVFDPFMGSGTTAVAAIRANRNFFGCDISEEYVNLALARIEKERMQYPLF